MLHQVFNIAKCLFIIGISIQPYFILYKMTIGMYVCDNHDNQSLRFGRVIKYLNFSIIDNIPMKSLRTSNILCLYNLFKLNLNFNNNILNFI